MSQTVAKRHDPSPKSASWAAHDEDTEASSQSLCDTHDEAADQYTGGLVRMPRQHEHTYYVLIQPPKGGINGLKSLQRVAAKLSSRFDRFDNVVLRATRAEPYLAQNGKNGRHCCVLTAAVSSKQSQAIAEKIQTWPEVVGLHRKYSIETMLFQAFADIYDATGGCIPVPPGKASQQIKLDHEPYPAISLDALETMVAKLDLNLQAAQVRSSFEVNSDAAAQRSNWHSVAMHVARCLRPNRQHIEDTLSVLEASSSKSGALRQPGTISLKQLRTALLTLREKLGLANNEVDAVVHRAGIFSDGSNFVNYKLFLLKICSGLEAQASPPSHMVTQRQERARQLEGSRSREVAKTIAADWKSLNPKEREKYENLAKLDLERFCFDRKDEIVRHKKLRGVVVEVEEEEEEEAQAHGEKTQKHVLPRWGVETQVKPPRSAFGLFSSVELARYLSDDSFNRQYRVSGTPHQTERGQDTHVGGGLREANGC